MISMIASKTVPCCLLAKALDVEYMIFREILVRNGIRSTKKISNDNVTSPSRAVISRGISTTFSSTSTSTGVFLTVFPLMAPSTPP